MQADHQKKHRGERALSKDKLDKCPIENLIILSTDRGYLALIQLEPFRMKYYVRRITRHKELRARGSPVTSSPAEVR